MTAAIDEGMRLTPPYGKSAKGRQMRQRDAAMRALGALNCHSPPPGRRNAPPGGDDDGSVGRPLGLRRFLGGLLAIRHELLAILAVKALGIGILGALQRRGAARLLGLLFGRHLRRGRCRGRGCRGRRRGLRERRAAEQP